MEEERKKLASPKVKKKIDFDKCDGDCNQNLPTISLNQQSQKIIIPEITFSAKITP